MQRAARTSIDPTGALVGALRNKRGTATHVTCCSGVSPGKAMEIETMSAKILPAIVVGLLLATTALASAQTRNYQQGPYGYRYQRMAPSPYSGGNWRDPYAGTYWEGVAP